MQRDVLSRLEEEGDAIRELDALLRDRMVAFDALLRDSVHLGLDERHLSHDTRALIAARRSAAGAKRTGRFSRRRASPEG